MSMSTSWLILDELAPWRFRGSERGASSTKSLSIATSPSLLPRVVGGLPMSKHNYMKLNGCDDRVYLV